MGEQAYQATDVVREPIGPSEEVLAQIEVKMREFARMYHAQHELIELDMISLLQDALAALGLTTKDLSSEQLNVFADIEEELFNQYILEDDPSDGDED